MLGYYIFAEINLIKIWFYISFSIFNYLVAQEESEIELKYTSKSNLLLFVF